MTEKEYFKIKDRDSYSSCKKFDDDRITYYKEKILGQFTEKELSLDMKLGSLVDCKLFSPELVDEKFSVASCNAPVGQMGLFVEALCSLTNQCLDENLKLTKELSELIEEAFNSVKFDKSGKEVNFKKKDLSWLVKEFVGSDAEVYYRDCRSNFGKITIDLNLVSAADKIIEELQTHEWTKDLINLETKGDIEVINQLIILFEVEGAPFKAMLDKTVINHSDKEFVVGNLVLPPKSISPYDLKITWSGESYVYNYWKMKYYLQVASYYLGLLHYQRVERPELKDYTIPSIEFIVGSSNLNSNPLLYSTNEINVNEGLYGFELKSGRKFKGLYELVRDINWHKKNQLWRNSREVYENKGKMIIKPFEEE